jgi:hypothetical protein
LTTGQQGYINPTTDGNISWRSESTCSSDSEEALENWQNIMYEVSMEVCQIDQGSSLDWHISK